MAGSPMSALFDYAVQKAFHGFYAAMHEAIENFPVLVACSVASSHIPLGNHFHKPKESLAKRGPRRLGPG